MYWWRLNYIVSIVFLLSDVTILFHVFIMYQSCFVLLGYKGITDHWSSNVPVFCSEFPCAPPPSRCKSAASLADDDDDPLVHITLKLVDRNCPYFVSKHNSVSHLHFFALFILICYNKCLRLMLMCGTLLSPFVCLFANDEVMSRFSWNLGNS